MLPVASGPGTWRVRGRLFVCPWWEPSAHGKGKSKGKAKGKTAAWKQFSSHVCPVRLSQGLGGLRFRVDSQAQPGEKRRHDDRAKPAQSSRPGPGESSRAEESGEKAPGIGQVSLGVIRGWTDPPKDWFQLALPKGYKYINGPRLKTFIAPRSVDDSLQISLV